MTDTTSAPPPPTGGGNFRLVLIALLFLGAGGGLLWWALSGGGGETETVADLIPDAGPPKPKPSSDLFLPDDIPDAGPEVPEEPDAGAPAKRPRRASGGAWDCNADIDRGRAAAVISAHRAQVRSCYERALKQNNFLSGTLNVEVKVGSGGRVEATRFGGSLRDRDVRSCVSRLTRTWRFPAPDGRCAVIAVPFNLTPRP